MDSFERWLDVDRYSGLSAEEARAGMDLIGGIRRWLLGEAALRAGDTVLEIGCGTGETLPALLDAVGPQGRVLAVDTSPGLCGRAAAVAAAHRWAERACVQVGDMRALPYAPASIDAVVCRSVLQYAGDGLPEVAGELARVLRPGGRLAAFEVLSAEGAPLLPVPVTEAHAQVHAAALARWRRLPWGLTRADLSGAFRPPLFCPVTLAASLTEWHQPFSAAHFAGVLAQVPRPGCPTLAHIYTDGLSPSSRAAWESLLAEATHTAQVGAWAHLSARRAGGD